MACKCVWYCDKECQNKHWKEHKKECKRIKKLLDERGGKLDHGNELDVGPIGTLPPQEECLICMMVLPLHDSLHRYFVCCGKMICCGCDLQHSIQTKKVNVERAQMQQPPVPRACAFCRTTAPRSDEELLARLRKRIEGNDPSAMLNHALDYGYGKLGLPVDHAKCIELLRQSAGLGFPAAQYQLGSFYDTGAMGLAQNEEEGMNHWKEAAKGGNLVARHNLGNIEYRSGNYRAAMHHWRLSASGGFRFSIDSLIGCFERGWLRHSDLAETLQVMYRARAEMKSENRDQYIMNLKMTGQYKAEYGC